VDQQLTVRFRVDGDPLREGPRGAVGFQQDSTGGDGGVAVSMASTSTVVKGTAIIRGSCDLRGDRMLSKTCLQGRASLLPLLADPTEAEAIAFGERSLSYRELAGLATGIADSLGTGRVAVWGHVHFGDLRRRGRRAGRRAS